MSTTPTPTASLSDVCTVVYDHREQNPAAWHVNNTTQVNPIPFDYLPQPTLVTSGPQAGSMLFMASYSQNLAGGLIGTDIPFPPAGCSGRRFNYAAMRVKQFIPAYPAGTILRNENDFKWTILPPTNPNTPNQANLSTEISDAYGWRLDPSGKAWVSTGYFPSSLVYGQVNAFQITASTDGSTVWSVTGLKCNSEPTFIPTTDPSGKISFVNIPLITTNWSAGLHPQLQWEGGNAPFCATVYYGNVQIVTSDAPVPMLDPSQF